MEDSASSLGQHYLLVLVDELLADRSQELVLGSRTAEVGSGCKKQNV